MAQQPRLSRVFAGLVCETDDLLAAFECPKPQDILVAVRWNDVSLNTTDGCVVRLYDSWNRFCRELIICSAAMLPMTASGTIVGRAPKISRRADVLPTLILALKKKPMFGEPRWADAQECLTAAKALTLVNYSTVSAAIGATPSPADDIRKTRNFVAHRNPKTAIELRAIASAYGAPLPQVESMLRHVVSPGITIFAKWIEELRTLAEASIQ